MCSFVRVTFFTTSGPNSPGEWALYTPLDGAPTTGMPISQLLKLVAEKFQNLPSRFFDDSPSYSRVASSLDADSTDIRRAVLGYQVIAVYSSTLLFDADGFIMPPFVSPNFSKIGNTMFELTYTGYLQPSHTPRLIFKATATSTENDQLKHTVVVKIARKYSKEAHHHLMTLGLAPQVFFCERVEELDNQWVIAMEYVQTRDYVKGANKGQVKAHLRKAVKELHEIGLVHDDLRHVNILITDEGAMLVDFDWAGKVGHAQYPMRLNGDVEWPSGVRGGGKIRMEHDEYMLVKLEEWMDVWQ